ncbi:NifU family protein [Culicoidibacter larvae]|uniref:NifU family protein n=1 Tax=Culicoidibacter larvae TaxID=2579976 RepID=A0A5R8Q967_9FIRM|nr:NifU family protein [Culicoidibacter larvae]TLG72464.1 NifU family protein [Culicoidibacter larvae]
MELTRDEQIEKIKEVLNLLRPYLQRDGGDVEFVDFNDGIVQLKMLGACQGCAIADVTVYDGIERALVEEVPGVIGVETVEDDNGFDGWNF